MLLASTTRQTLENLGAFLDKAEAHAVANKFDLDVLLSGRLAPSMKPFIYQVQSACDYVEAGLTMGQRPLTRGHRADDRARSMSAAFGRFGGEGGRPIESGPRIANLPDAGAVHSYRMGLPRRRHRAHGGSPKCFSVCFPAKMPPSHRDHAGISEKVAQPMTEAKKTGGEMPSQAVATAILDAAERRIRTGGYDGFSFRDIAADVGVKSSSVHYHFPTKEQLAVAVIRRYTDAVAADVERGYAREKNPAKVWVQLFRSTLRSEKRMCPCIVLGAASIELPEVVASEVRRFFSMCLDKLIPAGFAPDAARHLLSTITGALVMATALRDLAAYDRATRALIEDGAESAPRRSR